MYKIVLTEQQNEDEWSENVHTACGKIRWEENPNLDKILITDGANLTLL